MKLSSECLVSYDPHFPGNDGTNEACRAEGNRRAEFHTCERIEAQAVVRRYAVGELVEEA